MKITRRQLRQIIKEEANPGSRFSSSLQKGDDEIKDQWQELAAEKLRETYDWFLAEVFPAIEIDPRNLNITTDKDYPFDVFSNNMSADLKAKKLHNSDYILKGTKINSAYEQIKVVRFVDGTRTLVLDDIYKKLAFANENRVDGKVYMTSVQPPDALTNPSKEKDISEIKMKITRRQLRRIIQEAQWGRFTGGAAPLDEPPMDSGPMTPEDQQRVFDMLVDSGSDPKELKATGDYPDVDSMSSEVARRYLKRKYDWLEDAPQEEIHPLDVNRDGKLTISEMKITRRQLRQIIKEELSLLESNSDSDRGEKLDPDLLKGAYVSSKEDREAMKDYIAKLKAKKKSMDSDGDGALDADELRAIADDLEDEEGAIDPREMEEPLGGWAGDALTKDPEFDPFRDYKDEAVKAAAHAVEKIPYPQGGMIESEIHDYLQSELGLSPTSDEIFALGDEALSVAGIMLGTGPDAL